MRKTILSLILALSPSLIFSQQFGKVGLTTTLSKVDTNPTLIKSEFNNLTFTIKSNNKEFLSPSYSDSYIYFRDDKIGIIIKDSAMEPILLRQVKLISKDEKEQKLIFYSKDGDFVTVDYGKNQIKWDTNKEKVDNSYVFENLSLGSISEIQECIQVFKFNQQPVSDLSQNSQNLIGLSEEEVIYKHSRFYEPPLLAQLGDNTNENDLILLFINKDDKQFQSVIIFDEHKICKYIMIYYPIDYLQNLSEIYDESFGKSAHYEWIERSGRKTYKYFIQLTGADDDRFIMHIKME